MKTRNDGVVLALVLVIALVLSTAIFTFVRRATLDAMIVHNRDRAARAEALARGGIQLATAVVLQDLLDEQQVDSRNDVIVGDSLYDVWARAEKTVITTADGDQLQLRIRDTGSLLNLNSIVDVAHPDAPTDPQAEEFLTEFFLSKVIEEIPGPPGDKNYDARELARALIDFIDADDIGLIGSAEDDYYQSLDPPRRAANRPLLSVDELLLVQGFDARFVDALRPYVTVYPLAIRAGINLNTAPPHVLAALYHGGIGEGELIPEDTVRRILRVREENGIVCDDHATDTERCTATSELVEGRIFPPTTAPASSSAFQVLSRATVGDMERTVEAVIDRSKPSEPRLLFWRIQ